MKIKKDLEKHLRFTIFFALLLWASFGIWCCVGLYRHGHADCPWGQFQLAILVFTLAPFAIFFWLKRDTAWQGPYWLVFCVAAVVEATLASEHNSTSEGIFLGAVIFLSGFLPLRLVYYLREKKRAQKKSSRRRKR